MFSKFLLKTLTNKYISRINKTLQDEQSFNKAKIAIAIKKAFDSTYEDYDPNSINKIYLIFCFTRII